MILWQHPRLHSPSFSCDRCFNLLLFFETLHWTLSSMSMSPLDLGTHTSLKGWAERSNHLPQPAVNPLPRAAQGASGHFGHNGTLLVHPAGHPEPFLEDALLCQSLVCLGAWGCSLPRAGLCTTLCWASFLDSLFIQPLKIPLNGGTITWFINNSSQFCIQDLKENSGRTAQLTEMFPSIPKPTSPTSSGNCLSKDITTQLSQTEMTCTQQVKDLSMNFREWQWFAMAAWTH